MAPMPSLKMRWPVPGIVLPVTLAAILQVGQALPYPSSALAALSVICTSEGTIEGAEFAFGAASPDPAPAPPIEGPVAPLAGMPPVINSNNLYSETTPSHLSPATVGALERVYVPEHGGNAVSVIDPKTLKVVDHFRVGLSPQHIVPSWDLKTLWATNNNDFHRRGGGSLTPIDPITGKPGSNVPVDDPYNMYFMPDGSAAIVVNEANRRLEFRDPHNLKMLYSIDTPECYGINHADFSIDGTFALFSCEFRGGVEKIDLVNRKAVGFLRLIKPDKSMTLPTGDFQARRSAESGRRRWWHRRRSNGDVAARPSTFRGMPQDIRISPDGKVFYVADMLADGVFVVDAYAMQQIGFIPTGPGAHGFCVSRDGTRLYVSNRGSHAMPTGTPHGPGSVSVIDFSTKRVMATWPIPGGGSPDMGGVSGDGAQLWFSGRFDDEVYVFDTGTGSVTKIKVGSEPHGLTVWPQPGRYSLGHTGILR